MLNLNDNSFSDLDASLRTEILAEQTKQFYKSFTTSLIATIINAPILVVVLWPAVDHNMLLIWLSALMTLTLFRAATAFLYQKGRPPPERAHMWYRRFLVGTLLASLLWGFSAAALFPAQDYTRQVFLAFVLGGMAAGAVTSLAYIKLPFYAFLCLTLLPLIFHFLYDGSELGNVMGVMLGLYMIMLSIAASRTHNTLKQNIWLQIKAREREARLQESESRYHTLLETATDAFFLYDIDGRLVDVNLQACKMMGYARDEMLKLSILDIKVGSNMAHQTKLVAHLEGTENIQYESIYRRKNGRTFPVEVSAGSLRMDGEKFFSALVRDATTRKNNEAILLAATREAERANAAKSEFLSRMSHELRTPLNAILGFAQLLELDSGQLDKTQQGNVMEIIGAGHHLLNLINDVLDISKGETGKLEVSREPVLLDDIMQHCLSLTTIAASARGVKLIDNISNKGYIVCGDVTRLKQVFVNLLSNAVKYNREQGRITINAEIKREKRLHINFIDTGEGLKPAEIKKLFASFERLNIAHNVEGAGIGLVITKYLVQLMGGEIGVESTLGKGSNFWIELDLLK